MISQTKEHFLYPYYPLSFSCAIHQTSVFRKQSSIQSRTLKAAMQLPSREGGLEEKFNPKTALYHGTVNCIWIGVAGIGVGEGTFFESGFPPQDLLGTYGISELLATVACRRCLQGMHWMLQSGCACRTILSGPGLVWRTPFCRTKWNPPHSMTVCARTHHTEDTLSRANVQLHAWLKISQHATDWQALSQLYQGKLSH